MKLPFIYGLAKEPVPSVSGAVEDFSADDNAVYPLGS